MQLIKISLLALLSGYAAAQDIDDNDVPTECRAVCQVVTQLTQQCDTQNNDIDSGYINCVCSYNNAASLIPACEACIANYDTNDGHDNDVNDLIRSCSFTTTVFVSGAGTSARTTASTSAAGSASVTTTSVSTGRTTLAGGSVQSTTATSTGVVAANTNSVGTTASTAAGNAAPTTSGNAAAGRTVEMGVAGSVFLGVVGFLGLI
ncbi:hypothetical protein GLAREA_09713 [Glarea lozoyensis ATCC 20868]|uniref:Gpi anchored protein n=1 Tax=Glarea lozoyensis (strain ATCC 20868 / MF5171) TaxID=1116229 RepID=S3CQ22_GLAL2|nr:uncharacterized protein GLAREA_09713 [Glarea lozoyensis ATCC 20868]EPE28592.1 hypothetical protein GLAREA_09713 [Glarea lozoyensis ATCC 20868]